MIKHHAQHQHKHQGGFTILEIIMVVVILGIIMTFLVSRIVGTGDKAKVGINKSKMTSLKAKIDLYRVEYNALPQSLQSLIACDQVTGPGCVPSATEEELRDAWGTPFQYKLKNGRSYEITSLGADGQPGGEGADYDTKIEGP